jgi:molybdopterin converting factor small subunit
MNDVCVRLPEALRSHAGGAAELQVPAGTVSDVLGSIGNLHPQLKQRLLDHDGELRPFVNIFLGRDNVRGLQGLETPVAKGSVVSIIPAVAGG